MSYRGRNYRSSVRSTIRLPIDTVTVKFAAAGPAEPVLDYETQHGNLQCIEKASDRAERPLGILPLLEPCFLSNFAILTTVVSGCLNKELKLDDSTTFRLSS